MLDKQAGFQLAQPLEVTADLNAVPQSVQFGLIEPVGEIRAGIQVEPGNPRALADAVLQLRGLSRKERADMGLRGRNAAVEQYEYGMLAMKLAEVLFSKRASTKDARRRP